MIQYFNPNLRFGYLPVGNKLLTWWKSRKINDWKNANKTIENCNEQLDNRRFKVSIFRYDVFH